MEVENFPDLWYRQNEEEKYNVALERAAQFLVTLFQFLLLKFWDGVPALKILRSKIKGEECRNGT